MRPTSLFSLSALVALASSAALAPLTACSSDDASSSSSSSSSSGGTGTVGETVSVPMTAAAGGTLADKGGTVSLVVPPGALDKDTTITLTVGGAASGTITNVYDFGPDGLKFLKPVALEIKGTPPEGKDAAIAYESGGRWKTVAGSSVDRTKGTVKASTDHFTKYSIVVVDGQATLQPPATCAQAASDFTPCGGDPTGTWAYAEFCLDPKTANDPFQGKCPNGSSVVELTDSRVVTVDATNISHSAGTVVTKQTLTIPPDCLTANNTTCTQISNPSKNLTCAESAPNCICTQQETTQKDASQQAYTTSGSTMTVTEKDGSTTSGDYCVKSNLLYYREKTGSVLYVMTRK